MARTPANEVRPKARTSAERVEGELNSATARAVGLEATRPSFRPDPEKMQRVFRNEDLVRIRESQADVEALSGPPLALLQREAAYRPGSREYDQLERLARAIRPDQPEAIVRAFVTALQDARVRRPSRWRRRGEALDGDWFLEPWYALDARHFRVKNALEPASFTAIAEGLSLVADLGFRNVIITNHYETENVSGCCGVQLHAPGHDLGGAAAFVKMIDKADRLGLRVVTSAAFHRTSVLHPWFTAAGIPDAPQSEYYREAPAKEAAPPLALHPGALRLGQRFMTSGPGMVVLDLSNPRLLSEVLGVLGDELNVGVLGKRSTDLRYSAPGRVGYALRALLKLFMWSLSPRSVLIIHSSRGCSVAPSLAGPSVSHGSETAAEQADLVWASELSIALRESIYSENRTALETWIRRLPELPLSSGLLAFVEDEKSVPLNLTSDPDLWRRLVSEHGGVTSPDGTRVALRHGDLMNGDSERIALSLFLLYMLPGTPLVQQGTELGLTSSREEHDREENRRASFLRARSEPGRRDVFYEEPPLLRARMTHETHKDRLKSQVLPGWLLRELNQRWRQDPALRSRTIKLLPIPDRSVFAWLKGKEPDTRLMVANLCAAERRVLIETRYLSEQILSHLASGELGPRAEATLGPKGATVTLRPYGWFLA